MNQKLIHEIVQTAPRTLPYGSPSRARTVRRAIYIERARMGRDEPSHPLFNKFDSLIFRVKGPMLVIEHQPGGTVVEQQTRDLLSNKAA